MAEKKITKVDRFNDIISLLNGEKPTNATTIEVAVEFIENEISMLKKKNSSKNRKADAIAQALNEKYMPAIVSLLRSLPEKDPGLTCNEILRKIPGMFEDGCGSQKVAYMVGKRSGMLGDRGIVLSHKVKGETRYYINPEAPATIDLDGEETTIELVEDEA